jgi:hypothetical protein
MAVKVFAFAAMAMQAVAGAKLDAPHDREGHVRSWMLEAGFWMLD